ncbi:MAG: hypothetical protein CVU56_19085 [Deltaproteobacteria bacterium HGW-Deltaproteobacteria-14]|jgi:hypothetical protein|nr:MAG: hypothetical protein CVU56_19085 [Deltaproteobacteria bacterium HGW-Deltaproteobacteria-14]
MRLLSRSPIVGLALLAALTTLPPPAAAQPGGLTVEATTPWSLPGWPVPVQVLAYSVRDTVLDVEVSCDAVVARASIPVAAGARVRRTVLVPAQDPNSLGCAPRVKWRTDDGDEGITSGTLAHNELDVVLVGPHPAAFIAEEWRLAEVPATSLPDRWQGFPLEATFVIGADADAALTDAQRAALATWSRAGGRLLLLGLGERRSRWDALGAVPTRVTVSGYGEAVRDFVDEPRVDEPTPWNHRVPGTETVPVGGFLLVALAFAILAGPVNLWWVIKRRNQRGLFLLTTPLLSVVACGVLIGYNLLSEGLGVRRAAVQLTWLDGAHHSAVSFTGVTFFAGTGVGDFSVAPEVLVRPLTQLDELPGEPFADAVHPREVRWIDTAQELGGEWIPTRVNRQLTFVSPAPDRRRLTLTRTASGYEVVNGLDVGIRAVWWFDQAGRAWTGADIAAGHSGALREAPAAPPGDAPVREGVAPPNRALAALPGGVPFGRLGPGSARVWQRAAAPGHFAAELERPLSPIPGPAASDEAPLEAWVVGPLTAGAPPPAPDVEVAP